MGRWHSIAAKKASGDMAKSKSYSMMSKVIQIAAKKGADPKMNPSLELALQKAKYYGVTKDIIDRAILKGSGQLEGEDLFEMIYEGYGPGGIAILIKTLSSNSNRTSQNIRLIMNKFGGTLGQQGSVARQFSEKGVIIVNGTKNKQIIKGNEVEEIVKINELEFENQVLEFSIDDLDFDNGLAIVYTSKKDFISIKSQIENLGYSIQDADIQYIANNEVSITQQEMESLNILLEELRKDEDIENVFYNIKE